jgi:hypothetical protein
MNTPSINAQCTGSGIGMWSGLENTLSIIMPLAVRLAIFSLVRVFIAD